MRKMVRVTKNHIKNGKRNHCTKCPIALAITENIGELVIIGSTNFYTNDSSLFCYKLSKRAARFISKFDQNGPKAVKPFIFYINI